MRIMKARKPLDLIEETKAKISIRPGVEYIVPDALVYFVRHQMGDDIIEDSPYNPTKYAGEDLTDKSLICFRNGGIGDLIFITASLKKMREKYPTSKLTLSCNSAFVPLLKSPTNEYDLLPMPLKKEDVDKYDYVLFFQDVIENNPRASKINAYDLLAETFGLEPDGSYTAQVSYEKSDILAVREFLYKFIAYKMPNHESNVINVAVQIAASVPKRSVPLELYKNVIMELPPRYRFWFFGSPGQQDSIDSFINIIPSNIRSRVMNASKFFPSLSGMAAFIKEMDFVIGPDSSMLHIAGGLDIPMIGIYGPFPSDLRLRYYKNAIGIDANSFCEFADPQSGHGCFEHGNGSCRLAMKTVTYYSPCLSLIKSSNVLEAIKALGFPIVDEQIDKAIYASGYKAETRLPDNLLINN